MARIVFVGMLAALFFSSTFILNRAMSLDGGHWLWSASLRYFWMLGILLVWLGVTGKARLGIEAIRLYLRTWKFWTLAGGIGFGVFYALISFSASFAPGWVVAATWQTTILATPLVLLAFGKKVPLRAMLFTTIIFAGVVLINLELAENTPLNEIFLGVLPVLVAAFAYPIGNQLVWEAQSGVHAWVPKIDHPALRDSLCRVLMLTLGSMPLWFVLIAVVAPPVPSSGQLVNTLLVALFSGVAATSLFLSARHMAKNASELAAADCTQSMEVVFSLAGEAMLLGGALPGVLGWGGIGLTMLGLYLYMRVQHVR